MIEIPSGLIRPQQRQTLENVELRATLEKAVEDAKLNVSERFALNQKFFPNGGGFNLAPKDKGPLEYTVFYRKGEEINKDTFTKELLSQDVQNDSGMVLEEVRKSSKSNFQTNLENALKKLQEVLKGNI